VARLKETLAALAPVAALGLTVAAAPAGDPPTPVATTAKHAGETNEQIVADFFARKGRAEKAQRAIVGDLRRSLDQKRAEFEDARRRFDDARGRYSDIAGPLLNTHVVNPADPRLPYEFELKRYTLEPVEPSRGVVSQRVNETAPKAAVSVPSTPK
jgi:hypothetical protein